MFSDEVLSAENSYKFHCYVMDHLEEFKMDEWDTSALQEEVKSLKSQISSLQDELNAAKNEIATLQQQLENHKEGNLT